MCTIFPMCDMNSVVRFPTSCYVWQLKVPHVDHPKVSTRSVWRFRRLGYLGCSLGCLGLGHFGHLGSGILPWLVSGRKLSPAAKSTSFVVKIEDLGTTINTCHMLSRIMRYARPMRQESNFFGRVPTFPNTSRHGTQNQITFKSRKRAKIMPKKTDAPPTGCVWCQCESRRCFGAIFTLKLMSWSASPRPTRWIACTPGVANWCKLITSCYLKTEKQRIQGSNNSWHNFTEGILTLWHHQRRAHGHMTSDTIQSTRAKSA